MRTRLLALLFLALVWLSACSQTVEGIQDDTNRNIDDAQEEVLEEDGDG